MSTRERWGDEGPVVLTMLAGLFLALFAFLPGPPFRLEQYDLPKDGALGLIGVSGGLLLLRKHRSLEWDACVTSAVALIAWGVMSALVRAFDAPSVLRTVGALSASLLAFLLARSIRTLRSVDILQFGVIVMVVVMCSLVLLEAYGGIPFISAPGRRPGATLGNRNLAARLACLALPVLWSRIWITQRTAIRVSLYLTTTVLSAAIVMSRSRAAVAVALLLALSMPVISHWRTPLAKGFRGLRVPFAWFVALGIGGLSAVFLPNRLGWTAASFADSAKRLIEIDAGTGRGRIIQATTTWRIVQANTAWGVGPGRWSVLYPGYADDEDPSVMRGAYYPEPQIPRNDVLTFVAEWGVVGSITGLVVTLALGARATRLLRAGDHDSRASGALLLWTAASAAILGLFDSVLRVSPTLFLLSLIVGLAWQRTDADASSISVIAPKRIRVRSVGIVCALIILSAAYTHSALREFRVVTIVNSFGSVMDLAHAVDIAPDNVEARALLAYVLVSAGRCDLARPHYLRAAQLQPFSLMIASFKTQCADERLRRLQPEFPGP